MNETWTWLALAGLGAFHGLNPGMGWLFAVALGLHQHDRRIVWLSAIPIALGHALSVAVVAGAFFWAGLIVDAHILRARRWARADRLGALSLALRPSAPRALRHADRVGRAGVWSFLMATAHGAGLMLWPVLMPLCVAAAAEPGGAGPLVTALIGIGVHTLAMLAVTTAMAVAVYEWIGLEILRRAWINVDLVWTWALVVAGVWLLLG